jgi:DNA primase large subunit
MNEDYDKDVAALKIWELVELYFKTIINNPSREDIVLTASHVASVYMAGSVSMWWLKKEAGKAFDYFERRGLKE